MIITLLSIVYSFLTTCAFTLPFEVLDTAEIAARMPGGSFGEKITAFLPVFGERMFPRDMLLFPLLFILYRTMLKKVQKKHFSLSALLLSCLFTLYMTAGECAIKSGDQGFLFSNMPQFLITLIKTAGFIPFFYYLIRTGFALIDERKPAQPINGVSGAIFDCHPFAVPFAVILICWLPYLIAFYPGFVPSDGLKQLNNFFGSGNFTDNHPAFSTMMMGWAMEMGRRIGNDNLGIFLFTGPQVLANIAAMAACFPLFRRLKTPVWLRWTVLLSFALLPMWPNYAYSLLKDSWYMALILIFTIQLLWILLDARGFSGKTGWLILMTACLCLMMLTRHEGKYIASVIFLSLFTLPAPRKEWKRLLPVLLIPLCVVTVFNRVIRPRLGIPDAPAREALTMPFRQTSAVVLRDEESLTEEEEAVLRELFEYEKIPDMYSVYNADYLKGLFDPWAPREAVIRYLRVWAGLGLKHPLLYLNVFLSSGARYYYPFTGPHRDIYGWFGIEQESYVNKGLFDIHYTEKLNPLRQMLINTADGMARLPLTSLFYSLGANAWVLLFCLAYLLRKKIRGVIIPLLPGLITFITIQNSAINGFFRYLLPLMITLPVCACWTLYSGEQK